MKLNVSILILSSSMLVAWNDAFCQDSTLKPLTKTNSMTYPVKNISISINRSANEVYRFASNPENFPKWVAFVKSVSNQGKDIWLGKSDLGDIKIKWTPANDFGIIDHQVTLPTGETVNNPMRVISNNKGCEFIFTLFRMPNRTEKQFTEDAEAVTKDLQKLKEIMEH
jgi:hypothetical protein